MMLVSKDRVQGAGHGPGKAGQEQRVSELVEDHSWRLRWRLLRSRGATPELEVAIPLIQSLVQAIAGSLKVQVMC